MATGSDQVVGAAMMCLGALIFLFYSLWVIVMPFVEEDHIMQNYFPDRMYAILFPVVAGVTVLLIVGSFIAIVLLKSKKSEKKIN